MTKKRSVVPLERIERRIFLVRGQKVMLDSELAKLYGVATKVLIQAVRRNADRFPEDFMFQLSSEEFEYLKQQTDPRSLRSQIVTSKHGTDGTRADRGGRRYAPYVFTEQGVAMLSSVLRPLPRIPAPVAFALPCAAQWARDPRQHRNHARLRAVAANARLQFGTGLQARRARKEV